MKKICILISICLILCVGCDNRVYYWEFAQESSLVKEFKIVDSTGDLKHTVIGIIDIELIDEFYSDIASLEMNKYGWNLATPTGLCFMIVFENEDYDLIAFKESKHHRYENGQLISYNSWLRCNLEEFDKLINKYLKFAEGGIIN